MLKTLPKKVTAHIITKITDTEELLPEEEAAIEKGRRDYANGDWVSLKTTKNGVGHSRH